MSINKVVLVLNVVLVLRVCVWFLIFGIFF